MVHQLNEPLQAIGRCGQDVEDWFLGESGESECFANVFGSFKGKTISKEETPFGEIPIKYLTGSHQPQFGILWRATRLSTSHAMP